MIAHGAGIIRALDGATLPAMQGEGEDFRADVAIEAEAPPGDVARVEGSFRAVGVEADVEAAYIRRSLGDLPWVVYATLPIQAFLVRLAQNAADDAWKALGAWVRELSAARRNSTRRTGSIVLNERESGLTVVLSDEIPDEPLRELVDERLPRSESGYWVWDRGQQRWSKH